MRILEIVIVILVLSSAMAWIAYYYTKSAKKPPCGHCCGNLKKINDKDKNTKSCSKDCASQEEQKK